MSDTKLPPLPSTWGTMTGKHQDKEMDGYTADQMRGYAIDALIAAQLAAPAYRPVGTVRHFVYEGIAKNGHTIEATLFDGIDLADGATLYAAPQGDGK